MPKYDSCAAMCGGCGKLAYDCVCALPLWAVEQAERDMLMDQAALTMGAEDNEQAID